jgi:hypothetical protein
MYRKQALTSLSSVAGLAAGHAAMPILGKPHHQTKAKRVIFLYMAGGPSQFESFDDKPELRKMHQKALPESLAKGVKLAFLQRNSGLKCFGSEVEFKSCGQSGQRISNNFPHLQKCADDISIIRTFQNDHVNHDPAHTFLSSGTTITGRPSFGSWLSYGLEAKTQNLPNYIVLRSGKEGQPIPTTSWHSGFLPSYTQGVEFYTKGDLLNYINSPAGVSRSTQSRSVQLIQTLNRDFYAHNLDEEILTRNKQYELAMRMQNSVPDLANFTQESKSVKELYGVQSPDGSFASNCLMARRMAERGVGFIQLVHTGWDHHSNVTKNMKNKSKEIDLGCAALLQDLKQRGMLEDTLVVWGGEFGRTPMAQGSGRDHHTKTGAMWLAGGGVKGGVTYGETDPLGFDVAKDPFHVHDFHATAMHLLGIDHKKLTYRYKGRNFRLTDVHGKVIKTIIG